MARNRRPNRRKATTVKERRDPGTPYFCDDGLLVDPRPIGQWSIRWCPAEEFEYGHKTTDVSDHERLIGLFTDAAQTFRQWLALGMKARYEAPVITEYANADAVYMFETDDPKIAARMVDEAGIVWWRSSIFEVGFDDHEIYFDQAYDYAQVEGFETWSDAKSRAHLVVHDRDSEESLDAILEPYGLHCVTGAHGNWMWYLSKQEISQEQADALRAEIVAFSSVHHFHVGPVNRHDISEGPILAEISIPSPPRRRRKAARPRPVASGQAWIEANIREVLFDPRAAGVGDFPPIIDEAVWIGTHVNLIAELGPEEYAKATLNGLKSSFAGYAEMLAMHADHEEDDEEDFDPRPTEEIRESYLRGKRENPDDPLVVEVCDAGLQLLDAEVALDEAPLAQRTKARAAVTAATARVDAAQAAWSRANKDDQLNFLRNWKGSNQH